MGRDCYFDRKRVSERVKAKAVYMLISTNKSSWNSETNNEFSFAFANDRSVNDIDTQSIILWILFSLVRIEKLFGISWMQDNCFKIDKKIKNKTKCTNLYVLSFDIELTEWLFSNLFSSDAPKMPNNNNKYITISIIWCIIVSAIFFFFFWSFTFRSTWHGESWIVADVPQCPSYPQTQE